MYLLACIVAIDAILPFIPSSLFHHFKTISLALIVNAAPYLPQYSGLHSVDADFDI